MKTNLFVALEGLDGSGKSTQLRKLGDRLRSLGMNVYETAEPTASPIGSLIRNIMTGRIKADHSTIAALFVADRLDHIQNETNGICRKLADGNGVLTDRYYFSSYAYHSLHVPMEWVIEANSLCSKLLRPNLSIFLDVAPSLCVDRIRRQNRHIEIYETVETLQRVRDNYFESFNRLAHEESVSIVDANGSMEEVALAVWKSILSKGLAINNVQPA